MSQSTSSTTSATTIIGEPEVVEDGVATLTASPHWVALKAAIAAFQPLQQADGAVVGDITVARALIGTITESIQALAPMFPHDSEYLSALVVDFERWVANGLGEPDFLDSLQAFQPQKNRTNGLRHLVVFPMNTQNGSPDKRVEAVLIEVIWPKFIGELEAGNYGNKLFVPIRFLDFTSGYDTNSAVLFPETVAMREIPTFTWGAIFADREAARYRRVVRAAAEITKLELPEGAARLLSDQKLTEETFVMWDLIHDRTHMRGDLPFDPFMIKQRMPYFLYSLEELRCDLTAFREAVRLDRQLSALKESDSSSASALTESQAAILEHAKLVQYVVLFDRIFRFALTGSRTRNYDAVGGQLLFAWLHQHRVLHWTDTSLAIDWDEVPDVVVALSDAIDDLYWRSIDRPKMAHWLAAYELVSATLAPHPASVWAKGLPTEVLAGPAKGFTDQVLDDEFPLSMFYEALEKKMTDVIESTAGITA
jgi:hypothetical protein